MSIESLNNDLPARKPAKQPAAGQLPAIIDRIDALGRMISEITNAAASLEDTGLSTEQLSRLHKINSAAEHLTVALTNIARDMGNMAGPAPVPDTKKTKKLIGKKILLAEDDEITRIIALNILQRNGAEVTVAINGREATDMAAAHNHDIILMDMQMPELDGFEASKLIRRHLPYPTPIVGITANTVKDTAPYLDAGMNDVLTKPYNEEKLTGIILKWIDVQPAAATGAVAAAQPSGLYTLDKLREIGDQNFVTKMLQLFVAQIPAAVTKLCTAYTDGDFETMRYTIHRIRPSLLNMGVESLRYELTAIEDLAEAGQRSADLETMLSKLERIAGEVVTAVTETHLKD
ncbi:MAG: response regulator [Bacteroidota bacterium]